MSGRAELIVPKEKETMYGSCRLCQKINSGEAGNSTLPYDKIIFESPNFLVMPSIGSLVTGYLIIITKEHYLCMGSLPKSFFNELNELIRLMAKATECLYGSVAIFEHGPSRANCQVGCGVDHAHLHMVPVHLDLLRGANELCNFELSWEKIDNVSKLSPFYKARQDYLFLEQPLGNRYVATNNSIPSQLFRKVIAKGMGVPNKYDWNLFPFISNAQNTIDNYDNLILSSSMLVDGRITALPDVRLYSDGICLTVASGWDRGQAAFLAALFPV